MKYDEVLERKLRFDTSKEVTNPYAYEWVLKGDVYCPVMPPLPREITVDTVLGYTQCLHELGMFIRESTKVNPMITGSMILEKINATTEAIRGFMKERQDELAKTSEKFFNK